MKASRTPRSPSARRTSSGFGCEKAWSSRWRVAIATRAASISDSARPRGAGRSDGSGAASVSPSAATCRSSPSAWKNRRDGETRASVREAPPPGGPEPHHALGEFRERAIDALEDLGTVGVRLEKAQRLVEADERRRPREGAALERVEQAELLLPRRGIVAGGDGGEGIHEPPGP